MDENFDMLAFAPVSFVDGPLNDSHSDNEYAVICSNFTLMIINFFFDIYTDFLPDLSFAYSKLSFSFDPQLFPCAIGLLFQIQTKLLSKCSYIFWIQTTPET